MICSRPTGSAAVAYQDNVSGLHPRMRDGGGNVRSRLGAASRIVPVLGLRQRFKTANHGVSNVLGLCRKRAKPKQAISAGVGNVLGGCCWLCSYCSTQFGAICDLGAWPEHTSAHVLFSSAPPILTREPDFLHLQLKWYSVLMWTATACQCHGVSPRLPVEQSQTFEGSVGGGTPG